MDTPSPASPRDTFSGRLGPRGGLVLLFLTLSPSVWGQPRCEGTVLCQGLPVNYVWVGASDGDELITWSWTDNTGHFGLTDIPGGAYELEFKPDSEGFAPLTMTVDIPGQGPSIQLGAVSLESRTERPLQLGSIVGRAVSRPGAGRLPGGRVELWSEGMRWGRTMTEDREWRMLDLLLPIGPVDIVATDRFGLFAPDRRAVEIEPGQAVPPLELVCTLRWWVVPAFFLILALPAMQELIRRRLRRRAARKEVVA